uniref:hypothetical protein n=1 Tax=Amycolatopsis sp. CA-290885 TaxID=3239925 RepID=UPI003F496D36
MTTQRRPLKDYGPIQITERLRLATWQIERAMESGLLTRPDASGRWPAAAVDDALTRREEIVAAVGALPDMGASRAADVLAGRFGLEDVPASVLVELARRGVVPQVGEYKGHALYCGRALEAFSDRETLEVALRDGRLLMADEVAEYLRVRRSDVDQLVRSGWLVAVSWARSGWQRRREAPAVALYRAGDLDALLEDPGIDWEAVRSTAPGRRSPLARLAPRPGA